MYISFLTLLALPFMATISASNMVQTPLNGPADQADPVTPLTTTAPNLADLLTIQNSVSIFYSYAREIQLSEIFVRAGASNTLLVPTNPAVMALARKPHQGPAPAPIDDGMVISEQEYDAQSRKNVENWVSAHVIPSIISLSSDSSYDTLLDGVSVTVKTTAGDEHKPDWARARLNGNISVISKHEASNGVLYLIDGALYG